MQGGFGLIFITENKQADARHGHSKITSQMIRALTVCAAQCPTARCSHMPEARGQHRQDAQDASIFQERTYLE